MNGPVSAVLWDADQVLQDNGNGWRAEYDAFGGVTDAFLEDVWRAELPLMVGGDFPAALGEVARRHGVDAPVETLLSRWRSIVPLDGSWQVVDRLRSAGVRCYLATNQQEYRRAHIAATLGYDDRVDGARAAGLRAERWDHHDGLDALHRLLARHDLPATGTAG